MWGTRGAVATIVATFMACACTPAQAQLLGGLFGPKPASTAPTPAPAPTPVTAGPDLHVAQDGPCDDARPVEDVTSETPWCTLDRAVAATPEGRDVVVHASAAPYPALRVIDQVRNLPVELRGDGAPVIDTAHFDGSFGWQLTDLHVTGGLYVRRGSAQIQLDGVEVSGRGLQAQSSGQLRVVRSRFHDLVLNPGQAWNDSTVRGHGYGVRVAEAVASRRPAGATSSAPVVAGANERFAGTRSLEVLDSTFDRVEIDAVQVSASDDVLIAGNTVRDLRPAPDAHAEAFQIQRGCDRVLVQGNRVLQSSRGVYVEPGTTAVRIDGNLLAHLTEWGVNTHSSGTQITRNSMWDTWQTYGGNASSISLGSTVKGAVVAGNGMRRLHFSAGQIATEGWNFVAQPHAGVPYASTTVRGGTSAATARDPQVDPATFRPLPGSPLIDASTSQWNATPLDADGRPRADDPAVADTGGGTPRWYDIGALER